MLKPYALHVFARLALSASLAACSHQAANAISADNAAAARALGERLAAQDRANEAAHRTALAKLIDVSVEHVDEGDRTMRITLDVRNRTPKPVRRIDLAFVAEGASRKTLAMTELHCASAIAPHRRRSIALTIPYTQFGDDTGRMREAVGTKLTFHADVKEITYADGSDAGYDD